MKQGLVSIVGRECKSMAFLVTDHTQIIWSVIIEKWIDLQNVDPLIFIPLQ